MTSWDDAFLILKKWRDDGTWLWFGPVIDSAFEHEQDETTMAGASIESVRIKEVDSAAGIVVLDRLEFAEWDFTGATFEYSDERHESPFPDASPGQYPCALGVT